MTHQQKRAYDYISECLQRNGVPPSFDEIAAHVGIRNKSGAYRIVHALRDRGLIRFKPRRARSIELIDADVYHVRFTPDLERELVRYARETGTKPEIAIPELVRQSLGLAS